ncbi:sodium/potassium-transporting ATPase subunit beta-1-interacting protein 3 [Halyomorpha halys]|uniref:sodium/potassium-transporting ATPase subunit beta-1-interacting protein 3 n=1 Tax=Halyomorpha halys TaxID=286706 RepID=UPI0006D4C8A5|nr:sodium/potassium-transporting ATPase subunit beta-1-interacting protein [Halyomorpha halys]
MGCNKRLFLLSTCCSQLITTIWRQVFDFLGFMWCPIIVNFFQIIFVIFGFFGAWQYKSSYLLTYCLWTLFWIGWNSFIFCFYLNIGILNREWDVLSLGAGSVSWWEANGPGCKALFLPNQTGIETEPWHPLRPDLVTGCVIRYYNLEATQAALHAILGIIGFGLAVSLSTRIKSGEQESPSTLKKTIQSPLYPVDLIPRRVNNGPDFSGDSIDEIDPRVSRPMTPRRVKRRSDSRGCHTGSLPRRQHGGRSSLRSSRRNRSSHPPRNDETSRPLSGHTNLMFRHSPENSYDEERPPSARSSYSNFHGTRAHSYRHFLVSGPPGYTPQSETPI